ncbi:MAG: conjugal transfer protein TraH [Candidatus Thiodiazotropha taylori]|nr:conjugal transfer protein TraH [Candidatus Thiodiazotropha taylori]
MQSQLDRIYNDMENYTAPGAYNTVRRGSYWGGRYTYKTKIYDESLVSMKLPSAKGGCGGIDVFGGSFSFINSDQLVQLLRQVAANAKGYAFQLAMDNMCPDCMKWMNELQTKIQSMNEYLSNSCQLSQGLVNDTANMLSLKNQENTQHSLKASLSGIAEDFGDVAKHIGSADTAVKRIYDSNRSKYDESTGSVVYKALKQQQAHKWFVGGDNELIMTIMSMTGTIVIGNLVNGADQKGSTNNIWILPGNKLTITDLIEGARNKEIYDCSRDRATSNCRITPADTKSINIKGLKEKILSAFTGTNGLITWIKNQQIYGNLNQQQQNILVSMPHAIGSKIFKIAPISPEAAEQLVRDSIDSITLEYIYRLLNGAFSAVEISLANHMSGYKTIALQELSAARNKLDAEYNVLTKKYGSLYEIEKHYNEIIKNIQKPLYLSSDARISNQQE